jgi:lipoate-protein ligase A
VIANRLIIDPPARGDWNMGVDEALLIEAAEFDAISLRLYQWSEPTLSLGYFQRYDDRRQHAPSSNCAIVRRQTGGGAILHDHELTYSLTLPTRHPLARQSQQLYATVHTAFIAAVAPLIAKGDRSCTLAIRDQESGSPPHPEPFLCFERRAPGDVVLQQPNAPAVRHTGSTQPQSGWKVLGSAQRRHRGALLQHGSLLMKKSDAAPELPGLDDLLCMEIPVEDLSHEIVSRLQNALDLQLLPGNLPSALQSKARQLANNKYGSPDWTKRR